MKIRLLIAFIISSFLAFSQRTEIGGSLGTSAYKGDLAPHYQYSNLGLGGSVFLRKNISKPVTIKYVATFLQLSGSDKAYKKNTFPKLRNASFSTNLLELGLNLEYNFFNFRHKKEHYKFSPYLFGGLAFFTLLSGEANANISVPFGIGIKYMVSKRWNVGAEFGSRMTFTDKIDNLSDQVAYKDANPSKPIILGNTAYNDWYMYTGITLSYTIYKVNCSEESPFTF